MGSTVCRAVDDDPALDDDSDALGVLDVGSRIGVEQHEIGELADLDRAEIVELAEEPRRVARGDDDGVGRRDAAGDEQLQLAVDVGA